MKKTECKNLINLTFYRAAPLQVRNILNKIKWQEKQEEKFKQLLAKAEQCVIIDWYKLI